MNIIQRSSIPIYQQVFTFLLQTYRCKYLLQATPFASIRSSKNLRVTQQSFKIRHRLIWFADILRSYLTETVILSCTEDMTAAMRKAKDIDEMSSIHLKYVARLQEQALLSQNLRPIHKTIIALLDLGVEFHGLYFHHSQPKSRTQSPKVVPLAPKSPGKALAKSRRKSVIPALVEEDSSEAESEAEQQEGKEVEPRKRGSGEDLGAGLNGIGEQFSKLLPFVTAGLRSVGRVGAGPIWEMLADRLEWEKKKDRYLST